MLYFHFLKFNIFVTAITNNWLVQNGTQKRNMHHTLTRLFKASIFAHKRNSEWGQCEVCRDGGGVCEWIEQEEWNQFFKLPTPTQSSLPFCASVQFSHVSFCAFDDWIKMRENKGLWTVYTLIEVTFYYSLMAILIIVIYLNFSSSLWLEHCLLRYTRDNVQPYLPKQREIHKVKRLNIYLHV